MVVLMTATDQGGPEDEEEEERNYIATPYPGHFVWHLPQIILTTQDKMSLQIPL